MGINDRELVCTIVDLGGVVWVAGGGQRARRGQRGAGGKMEGTLEQVARDCLRELEGKEELGVEKGLVASGDGSRGSSGSGDGEWEREYQILD